MIRIIAVISFFLCSLANASDFFPKNDLGKYDNIEMYSEVTEQIFNDIITAGYDSYINNEAVPRKENITINRLWSNSTVNANVTRTSKFEGEVIINMYGGLARRPEVSPASFALVLCHELGHAYGGAPFIYAQTDLSAEGQADYYATNTCFTRIFEKVEAVSNQLDKYEDFIEKNCQDDLCRQALYGSKGLANLLAGLMKEKAPQYETPDKYKAPYTLKSYPNTVQCRLDTYRAGVFGEIRPACWFKS